MTICGVFSVASDGVAGDDRCGLTTAAFDDRGASWDVQLRDNSTLYVGLVQLIIEIAS